MTIVIHGIETAVPARSYEQGYAAEKMKRWLGEEARPRVIDRLYARSEIDRRHSVVSGFGEDGLFPERPDGTLIEPGTEARNDAYGPAARELAVRAARAVLDRCEAVSEADITHVIFVTCTGFQNPGVDYHLVRDLGLAETTQRYVLGFMGCYASLPALRMAQQFCAADPNAAVLVVSVELCTLHLQLDDRPDTMLANALFSDGAAAAIVSARPPASGAPALALRSFRSALLSDGEQDMAWRIGDRGFVMNLSSYVPKIIGAGIGAIVDGALADAGIARDDVKVWAIHPGGSAILEKVEAELSLDPGALRYSRSVLRNYGNMSSATSLFVLNEVLHSGGAGPVFAAAFGPGLTVESVVMELEPA